MQNQNMSDIIEAYIKKILSADEKIEIRRNEMADQFNCVPSQINYVINTRFTEQQGYLVESKRGGGGYIRIMKVKVMDHAEFIDEVIAMIDTEISKKNAAAIVQNLYSNHIITRREGNLMLSVLVKPLLDGYLVLDDHGRAVLLKTFLKSLRYQ